MIVATLDAASLGRVRLAPSPAFEALSWLKLAAGRRRHPVFGDPGASARFALRDPDVALLAALVPSGAVGYMPDLLTPKPPPGPPALTFMSQLEVMCETPDSRVAEEVTERFESGDQPQTVRQAMETGRLAPRAACGLLRFWKNVVADRWSAIRTALDADVSRRSATMSTQGVGAVVGSLHPKIHWDGATLRVEKPCEQSLDCVDTELVLVPSAFAQHGPFTQLGRAEDAVLYYPADGIGAAATSASAPSLAKLVGGTRARLLNDLDVPRSTAELSVRHDVAPATVSYHLSVLLGSGLVVRTRERRVVLYRRSDHARALLGA
ncbi:MAG: winged helix-turn-helix domain-containing protein [Jiangellaceae bacterium]